MLMLFQQQEGLARATDQESGIEFTPKFFIGLLLALMPGDVMNGIGYRFRPFEVEPGSTDRVLARGRILPSPSLLRPPPAASLLGQIRRVFSLVVRCGRGPRDAPARSEFQSVVLSGARRSW
jgi:hypothetical protein